jgi:Cysteine rich repeat
MITPRVFLAAMTCLACALPARADLTSACLRDYLRFCSTVVPGEGRVAKCLNANRASLSPACGEAFAAVASCRPEIERFCRSVPGPAQVKSCLQGKATQLGETCRQNLSRF